MIVSRKAIYKEPQITQQDRAINTTKPTNICQAFSSDPIASIYIRISGFTKVKVTLALDLG
jgi:hypothetical protein